jgi:hypothetical protein
MSEDQAPELPFVGVWIPAKVFNDARLTHSDKFLWSIIHILSKKDGCYATRETLARYMGSSIRNIQYSINRLTDCKYVVRNPNGKIWDVVSKVLEGEGSFTPTMKPASPEPCSPLHPEGYKDSKTSYHKGEDDLRDDYIRSDANLSKVWDEYLAWRKAHRKPSNNRYCNRWNDEFKAWANITLATQAVTTSLNNGYQGIFKPKGNFIHNQPKTNQDHAKGF